MTAPGSTDASGRLAGVARDVVVVGGGVAGLVAARELAATGRDVLLLEGSPEIGGKLRTAEVAGLPVDVGAEAMLARRPEGVASPPGSVPTWSTPPPRPRECGRAARCGRCRGR